MTKAEPKESVEKLTECVVLVEQTLDNTLKLLRQAEKRIVNLEKQVYSLEQRICDDDHK